MMKQQIKRYTFLAMAAALVFSWEPALAQRKKKEKAPPVKTDISNYSVVETPQQQKKEYKYETAQNDPLNARIYTLANGMKVYMTVYKDAPRIQTYIAVRAGSKNDPSDATGLAHYLEHMVFKGTDKYGSLDFKKEEPLVKQIEDLYEVYRKTTDEQKRKALYHQIDSVSGVAAKYAIANEYDKMIAAMGGQGSNAYTSVEQTVYVCDIPSNQLEKWLALEAERFRKPVMRLFHTELEAVYEEKNRSLDNDGNKAWEALNEALYQKHTYGTQTTIGTIEHLKNPSIKKINEYYYTYYVPNNISLCISGDFDPDQAIRVIDEKFGSWASKQVPVFNPPVEAPISSPIVKEVFGPEAENVMIGFRFPGANTREAEMMYLVNKILANGKAGLVDLNLNQKQLLLDGWGYADLNKDYTTHILGASPKEGQKLEEVQKLLLDQIELIKKGEFPDWLLSAIITDMKLEQTKMYEQNSARADAFVRAFIWDMQWQSYVDYIDRLARVTKQDVIDFVKKNYTNNYVVVYKRTGEDKNVQKVIKPEITPVEVNRGEQSEFLKSLVNTQSPNIEPVFLDYQKDIKTMNLKSEIPLMYTENTENKTFDLYYVFDMGTNNNRKLSVAIDYLPFLGTSKLKAAEVQQEFYKLGCNFTVFNSEDQVYVSLSGLSENFDKAVQLFEQLLSDAKPDKQALANLVGDILKRREDAKLDKNTILRSAMYNYGVYGAKSPFTNILSTSELKALKPEELTAIIKSLNSYEHHVLYYGPSKQSDVVAYLNAYHKVPEKLKPVPAPTQFNFQSTGATVYVVDYPMKQAEIIMLSKGSSYDKNLTPTISMFNEYFGGSMGSIVFQDMRESKALAYSVSSTYRSPNRKEKPYYIYSYIGTQADKLPEAMKGLNELMMNMPESEITFNSAKESVVQGLRTERITKSDILFNYERSRKMGLDYDLRRDIYMKVPTMTLSDIRNFQQTYVKSKPYTILVLGDKKVLDMETLKKYGTVKMLTLKDVFGY
jgi:predicted Zn-dependent peptidase